MKKALRYLLKSLGIFIALVLVYLATAFCLSRITVKAEPNTGNDIVIYIKTNGVHTDIVLPVHRPEMDWSKQIKFSNTVSKDSSMGWLAFGWGDKGFYLETPTWAELKFSTAFKAAFALGTTAIHATYYSSIIENELCKKLLINSDQYKRMLAYIGNSLQKDNNGNAIYISTSANYGENDAFYEANGKYSLFKTCNSWANKCLKTGGQKCCLWTAFDTGIFLKYK